jgi:demethylmenaquinone methyltransferase/2-methoxy-6-polyprenyl-1,4-benzoquinol methylase
MIPETISTNAARHFYDRLGARQDWSARYESRAKVRALELLALTSGQRVLNVGVGTGREQARLLTAVAPGGAAVGLDLSPVMLQLTQGRTDSPLCEADARSLPFVSASFDRLLSAYLLDLLPAADLPHLLAEFRRVLKPGGRVALVALTEGIDCSSRMLMGLWKLCYTLRPVTPGGCRPLQLAGMVCQAGFCQVTREVVVQLGMPSEVVIATRW